jgi:NAD(P)-dependent dehydrogenase (short-subunit alcohol dehydrogenase family)
MNNNTAEQKVWFITGASKGLGLTLAKNLLAAGQKVAATSRSAQALIEAAGPPSENFLPLEMDLLNEQSVGEALRQTLDAFGRIDTVVNNAGYGQIGTLEELSDDESRRNFDVNVFGLLNVIRGVMPHLRARRAGHIFNISSIGGYFAGFPGWGIYAATKFAVAGLTEALAAEAKAFGISATVVYPGYFRTNFLSPDSISAPANPIPEYEEARKSQTLHQRDLDGSQAGDPEKAAAVMIAAAKAENPPLHLFLGGDAYGLAQAKIAEVESDLERWRELAKATDFAAKSAG